MAESTATPNATSNDATIHPEVECADGVTSKLTEEVQVDNGQKPQLEAKPSVSQQVATKIQAETDRLKNFFLRTELHGLADVYEAKSTLSKTFWVITILICFGLLLYELKLVFSDFSNNPILTSYRLVSNSSNGLKFPSVYICPTHPIHRASWKAANPASNWEKIHIKGLLHAHSNVSGLGKVLGQKVTLSESLSSLNTAPKEPMIRGTEETPPLPWIPRDIQEYYRRVGIPTDVFLSECAFSSIGLNCTELSEPIFDGDYGKCFHLKTSNFAQTTAGVGLSLVIDLALFESVPFGTEFESPLYDGVVLKIAPELDIGSSKITLLHPGTYTKVALELTTLNLIQRDKPNIGQECVSSEKSDKMFQVLNAPYSPGVCHLDCMQQIVTQECACHVAIDKRFLQNTSLDYCTPLKLNTCAYPLLYSTPPNQQYLHCSRKCRIPCTTFDYKVTTSSAAFPSYALATGFPPPESEDEMTAWKTFQKKDLIIVDIAYSTLHYTELTQSLSMTFTTFVSNVGGQIGLWIGASTVTLIKFFVFLSPLFWSFVARNDRELQA